MNSGLYFSLHPNCHHQMIYTKFNLNIFYPFPYERVTYHYQDANIPIQLKKAFSDKSVNNQNLIFNETILKIMTNFIPHETKIFNYREPPWINKKVKAMIEKKNKIDQFYLKNKSNIAKKLETLKNLIHKTLERCKSKYYENIKKKPPKYYWPLLKTMLNDKKIFGFRLLFTIRNLLEILKKKLFNYFLAKQCLIIKKQCSSFIN